jgi:hypothetical protein
MLRNLPSFLIERRPLGERWHFLSLTLVLTAATWCCSLNHPGEAPSEGELYYPIAVTLPPVQEDKADLTVPPRYLFVANANFDLRYNAGSLQAFNLDYIAKRINSCNKDKDKCRDSIKCRKECEQDKAKCLACDKAYEDYDDCDPYQACVIAPTKALEDEVLIGSFAATAAFSPTGKRLYVPTRSNTSLTYVDVDPEAEGEAVLSCGEGSGRKCSDDYVRGDESIASGRELEITGESVGVVATRLDKLMDWEALEELEEKLMDWEALEGLEETAEIKEQKEELEYLRNSKKKLEAIDGVFVAQRNGTVAFFFSRDEEDGDYEAGPQLVHIVDSFQSDITNIGLDPVSGRAYLTSQEYSTTGGRKSLQRVGFFYDGDPDTSSIFDGGFVLLRGVSAERDTRAIAFSPLAEDKDKVFVVSRTPNALLIVDFATARTGGFEAMVNRTVKVGNGASRLALGQIGSDPRLFAFVSCFGSRELYIIDVDLAEPVAVIQGFSGPFEVTVDRLRKLAYVADFRSSIIRIVDLQPIICSPESSDVECPENLVDAANPIPCRIVATLGEPRPPEELI